MSDEDLSADPWAILGIDPGVTDLAVIRRAYAQGVRRHRPEDDPEGFRRVRAAYEWLTRRPYEPFVVDMPEPSGDEPEPGPSPGSAVAASPESGVPTASLESPREDSGEDMAPVAPPPPKDVAADLAARWRAAVALPEGPDRDAATAGTAEEMREAFGRAPRLLREVMQALGPIEAGDRAQLTLARSLRSPLLAESFLRGDALPVEWTCWTLLISGRLLELGRLAAEILPRLSPHLESSAAGDLMQLARVLVIVAPEQARQAVDLAWKVASTEDRRLINSPRIDFLVAVGHEVKGWPVPERLLLARAAADDGLSQDLSAAALVGLRAAVRDAGEKASVRYYLHSLLPGHFPSPDGAEGPAGSRKPPRRRRAARASSTSRGGTWTVLWALMVVGGMGRMLTTCTRERPSYSLPEIKAPAFRGFPRSNDAETQHSAQRILLESFERRLRRADLSEKQRARLTRRVEDVRRTLGLPPSPPSLPPTPDPPTPDLPTPADR